MLILNFSHPLTATQQVAIERLAGQPLERLVEVPIHVDETAPLAGQVVKIVDQAGLNPTEWQTLALIVNLPGYAPVAATLLAELEGRCGHLPTIIKLRPVVTPLTEYEVTELVNLQQLRNEARTRRY